MTKLLSIISIAVTAALLTSCTENVLTFPDPDPAKVRIINTTQDVSELSIVIDGTATVKANRGEATDYTTTPAGRPVGFVLKEGNEELRRDTLFYTLGGNGQVILFARGAKTGLVEFRRAIHDTTLAPGDDPVIRFTHMAENTDQFITMEVFFLGGENVFGEEFDPGLSSSYVSLEPGQYSFEVREWETTNVAVTLENITLERGKAYMLYAWDLAPPALDQVGLSVF